VDERALSAEIYDLLNGWSGFNHLRKLFNEILNYDYANDRIPTINMPDTVKSVLFEPPLIFGTACDDEFKLIYCRMKSDRLRLTDERSVITYLRKRENQIYSLFAFSDRERRTWHLVNAIPGSGEGQEDKAKRRLYLRRIVIEPGERYRTAAERLAMIDSTGARSAFELKLRHDEAFDVEKVTQKFFREYLRIFDKLQRELIHKEYDPKTAHDFVLLFLNRLMFIYFIQRKGWLGGDLNFIETLWKAYRNSGQKDEFYPGWLCPLQFAFNGEWDSELHEFHDFLPPDIADVFYKAPYLNGGLFGHNEAERWIDSEDISDEMFETAFNFFQSYNFTIREDTPFDKVVAVDPEMIGKVYESLVNIRAEGLQEIDQRGMAGIFYTPRVEIDLMCRLALSDWLMNHMPELNSDLIYELVFAFDKEEKEAADKNLDGSAWRKINSLLDEVTVLDPACGSGSFLVGMLSVLDDLKERAARALGEKPENPIERRKRIIENNLYGVDVMEWAVHVAEMRLWLQLVVESADQPDRDIPMLPHLSYKLRVGDSLVQEVGGVIIPLHKIAATTQQRVYLEKLERLKEEKHRFFRGEIKDKDEIDRLEREVFLEILNDKERRLAEDLREKRNRIGDAKTKLISAIGGDRGDSPKISALEKEAKLIEMEIEKVHRAKSSVQSGSKIPFVWDIAFADVFETKGGFDIVIGNPPYVRQERIAPPGEIETDYTASEWRKLKGEYKGKLQESAVTLYPEFFLGGRRKLDGKSDLYVYFYLHGLSLLNDKGSFCFITSNSWLDVGYGKDLQEFLLRNCHVKMIIDNEAKRSFAQADVNTVICLFSAPVRRSTADLTARFIKFKVPFEELVATPYVFIAFEEIAGAKGRKSEKEYRVVAMKQGDLLKEGMERGRYRGDKWGGKYLRAPDIFFTILEKGRDKLVRLGDIAEVRRGFTTGANEFFYLEPLDHLSVCPICGVVHEDALTAEEERKYLRNGEIIPTDVLLAVRNSAGWEGYLEAEFLKPVIKSPREIKTIRVRPEDLSHRIFMCHLSKAELRQQSKIHSLRYIEWGERQRYHRRPTCASREKWWDVGKQEIPPAVWFKAFNDRFFVPHNGVHSPCSDRLYAIYANSDIDSQIFVAALNSTLNHMIVELTGRVNLGEGALDNMTYEAAKNLALNPSSFALYQSNHLLKAFERIASREIGSIFEELGLELCRQRRCDHPEHPYEFVNPEAVSLDKVMPDHRELDRVVFEALGLTEEEQLEVYQAVVDLVKKRLVKARSV
jgi:hypothetical protein